MRDVWQSAESYEAFIGRWSRIVAREFIGGLPVGRQGLWLDVGCGSGALSSAIAALAEPKRVIALDRSLEFVEQSRGSQTSAGFANADAVRLPFRSGIADAAVSGLVLNFVSDPAKAALEMVRCLRPGGVVATYLWDYAGGMQSIRLFWDAAIAVDRRAADLDEAKRFPLCQPAALGKLFEAAGATHVRVSSIVVPMVFRNFDDLWSPFLGGQGPAPAYTMSLTEEQRSALRERLRAIAPSRADGSIALSAKAWTAHGVA